MSHKPIRDLVAGDIVLLKLPNGTYPCTVATNDPVGGPITAEGPMHRLTFLDAPPVVNALEKSADSELELL